MNETRLGELHAYCYMVDHGAKPAACMAIKETELDEALSESGRLGVLAHIEDLGYGWKTIWVYKRPFIIEVIKKAPEPQGVYDHWVLGKLFGYSDDQIESFIGKQLFDLGKRRVVALRAGWKGVGVVIEVDKLAIHGALVRPLARLLSGFRHRITSSRGNDATIARNILTTPADGKGGATDAGA